MSHVHGARTVFLRHLRGLLQQRNDRTAGDEVSEATTMSWAELRPLEPPWDSLRPIAWEPSAKARTLNKSRDSMPALCS